MNRTLRAIIAIVFVGIIMFCAISIAQNGGRNLRADITEKKLYTLSPGTQTILAGLREPLTVQLYYASTAAMKGPDQIKFFNTYYQFVKALLQEYEKQSQGRVKLQIIDPRPYSEEETNAMRYGLKRFPVAEDENFFFGLVLQTEFGVTKSIPFFSPDRQQFVEYDISYLIDTAMTRQKKKIGVLSSLPVFGEDASGYMAQMKRMQGERMAPPWNFITQLKEQFEVIKVEADTAEINPKDYDILMVVHPKKLPDQTLFAIDQYIVKGGRTMIFEDPHSLAEQAGQKMNPYQMPESMGSDLNRLTRAWGLEMPADTFAGDVSLALSAQVNPEQSAQKILGFMSLTSECFNHDTPITSELNQVRVLFSGILRKVEPAKKADEKGKEGQGATETKPGDAGAADAKSPEVAAQAKSADASAEKPAASAETPQITLTPLMSTTKRGNSWTVTNRYELMMLDPERLMKRFTEGLEPVHMAYMVTGKLPSAFPNGVDVAEDAGTGKKNPDEEPQNPDSKDKEPKKMKHLSGLTSAEQPCAVAVFADVDFISDMVAYQNTIFGTTVIGDNSALMLNTLDDLTGSSALISIRSRGSFQRPFTVINRIEEAAEKATAAEVDKINAKITGFQDELQKIAATAKDGDSAIIGSEIIAKKKQLELNIHDAQRELRQVKMKKRVEIEQMGNRFENINTLAVPGLILVVAILLGVYRSVRRRHYISHASDA